MRPTRVLETLVFTAFLGCIAFPLQSESLPSEPQPSFTDAERDAIVALMEASRSETELLAARATGDVWNMKPAPDRWSVGEVVEHLARAEEVIFGLAMSAFEGEPSLEWQTSAEAGSETLLQTVRDRSQKFQAPEMLVPTGEKNRHETLRWYAANRADTLDFVLSTEADVKAYFAQGPPGLMSVDKWMTLIAGHNQRHNDQIREVLDWIEAEAQGMDPDAMEHEKMPDETMHGEMPMENESEGDNT